MAAETNVSPVAAAHEAHAVDAPPKEKLLAEHGVHVEATSAEPGEQGCADKHRARRRRGRRTKGNGGDIFPDEILIYSLLKEGTRGFRNFGAKVVVGESTGVPEHRS